MRLRQNYALCSGVNCRYLVLLAGISVFSSSLFDESQAAAISSSVRTEAVKYDLLCFFGELFMADQKYPFHIFAKIICHFVSSAGPKAAFDKIFF